MGEIQNRISPHRLTLNLSDLTIADLSVSFEAARAGHDAIKTYLGRCDDAANRLVDNMAVLLGLAADDIANAIRAAKPADEDEAYWRAVVILLYGLDGGLDRPSRAVVLAAEVLDQMAEA